MSNEAITWAFKQELPMTDKFVLVALADYADEAHMCFPSHQKTAARIGASPDTVKRATKRLSETGYIDIIPWKRPNGSTTSNRYRLKVGGATCTPPQADTQGGYVSAGEAPGAGASPINHQLIPQEEPPTTKRTATADAPSGFDEFWQMYPDKRNKKAAEKAYKSALKSNSSDELKNHLTNYLAGRARHEKAGEFVPRIPYASTWLNGERWNDYLGTPPPGTVTVARKKNWADAL